MDPVTHAHLRESTFEKITVILDRYFQSARKNLRCEKEEEPEPEKKDLCVKENDDEELANEEECEVEVEDHTLSSETLLNNNSTSFSFNSHNPDEQEDQKESKNEDQKPDLGFTIDDLTVAPVEALLRDHRETVKDDYVADPVREMVETGLMIAQRQACSLIHLPCFKVRCCSNRSFEHSPRLMPPPEPPDRIAASTPPGNLFLSLSTAEQLSTIQCASTISFTSMLVACQVFAEMPKGLVAVWIASIQGAVAQRNGWKVFALFCLMKEKGIKLIGFTMVTFLKATTCPKTYSMCWDVSLWKQDHEKAIEMGLLSNHESLNAKEVGIYLVLCLGVTSKVEVQYNSLWKLTPLNSSNYVACWKYFMNSTKILIARYSNCGSPLDASKVFNMMPHTYTRTWNALIYGYVQIRFTDEVLCCLFKFISIEVKLELIVFVCKCENDHLNCMRLRNVDHEKSRETTFISLTAMYGDKFEEISYKAWKITAMLCQDIIVDGCTILVHGSLISFEYFVKQIGPELAAGINWSHDEILHCSSLESKTGDNWDHFICNSNIIRGIRAESDGDVITGTNLLVRQISLGETTKAYIPSKCTRKPLGLAWLRETLVKDGLDGHGKTQGCCPDWVSNDNFGCKNSEQRDVAFDLFNDQPRREIGYGNNTFISILILDSLGNSNFGTHVHLVASFSLTMHFNCGCVLDAFERFEAESALLNHVTYSAVNEVLLLRNKKGFERALQIIHVALVYGHLIAQNFCQKEKGSHVAAYVISSPESWLKSIAGSSLLYSLETYASLIEVIDAKKSSGDYVQHEMNFKLVLQNHEDDFLLGITFECQNCCVVAIFHRKMIYTGSVLALRTLLKWKTLPLKHGTCEYSSLRTRMF